MLFVRAKSIQKGLLRPQLVVSSFKFLILYIVVLEILLPLINMHLILGSTTLEELAQAKAAALPSSVNAAVIAGFLTPSVNWITSRGFEKTAGAEE